jgi:hypothetical protein
MSAGTPMMINLKNDCIVAMPWVKRKNDNVLLFYSRTACMPDSEKANTST